VIDLEYAASLDGLTAPSDEFLALITGGLETPTMAQAMARMSCCALVVRGLWRAWGVQHEILDRPYVIGHAVSDLATIARSYGALYASRVPQPGDAVIVGGGSDGGGVEHAYTVLSAEPDLYDEHVMSVTSIDGGQRTASGLQTICKMDRTLGGGWDNASRASDPGGGSSRRVRWVVDVAGMMG